MTESEFENDALMIARKLADAAWAAIQPHWRNLSAVENKERGHGYDPVTEADKQAELAMRAILTELRAEDGVRGEEFEDTPSPIRMDLGPRPSRWHARFCCGPAALDNADRALQFGRRARDRGHRSTRS